MRIAIGDVTPFEPASPFDEPNYAQYFDCHGGRAICDGQGNLISWNENPYAYFLRTQTPDALALAMALTGPQALQEVANDWLDANVVPFATTARSGAQSFVSVFDAWKSANLPPGAGLATQPLTIAQILAPGETPAAGSGTGSGSGSSSGSSSSSASSSSSGSGSGPGSAGSTSSSVWPIAGAIALVALVMLRR